MVTTLDRLCKWYSAQCDGEWEHRYGLRIETLDNPGWIIRIDLNGIALEAARHEPGLVVSRSESDWIHASIESNRFTLACGPGNLEEAIVYFLAFAQNYKASS